MRNSNWSEDDSDDLADNIVSNSDFINEIVTIVENTVKTEVENTDYIRALKEEAEDIEDPDTQDEVNDGIEEQIKQITSEVESLVLKQLNSYFLRRLNLS